MGGLCNSLKSLCTMFENAYSRSFHSSPLTPSPSMFPPPWKPCPAQVNSRHCQPKEKHHQDLGLCPDIIHVTGVLSPTCAKSMIPPNVIKMGRLHVGLPYRNENHVHTNTHCMFSESKRNNWRVIFSCFPLKVDSLR